MKKPLTKKTKRWFLVGLIILCLALLPLGVNFVVIIGASPYIRTLDTINLSDADCILVLGAKVYDDQGSMCDMLQDRVNIAVQLVNKGVSDRILMSGDHGKVEYDEVNSMMQYSIDKGMDENKVFLDHAGFSTYESMYRARDVFACKKIVIVTQGFHLYRAVYDARALGLEAYGVASDSRDYGDQDPLYLREDLARCKDFIYCIFQPEPTYLGSCIPIYGDSSATKDK